MLEILLRVIFAFLMSSATFFNMMFEATTAVFSDFFGFDDPIVSEVYSPEELEEINKLRKDYDYGTCKSLKGDISVVLFYVNDFESEWTDDEITSFTNNEITPGLVFLENEAKSYGVDLDFNIVMTYDGVYYNGEVVTSITTTGYATIDVLNCVSKEVGFSNSEEMLSHFKEASKTDEVVCFTVFNKNGGSYAINPKKYSPYQADEHCIIFSKDLNPPEYMPVGSQASLVARDVLYLYGAESLTEYPSSEELAYNSCPKDVMLFADYYIAKNNISDVTAFYIGWINDVPEVMTNEGWK